MQEHIVIVKLNEAQDLLFNQLANTVYQSEDEVVSQAISDYLELQAWQIKEVKKGIEEADNGVFATDEEVAEVRNKYKIKH